MSPRTTVRSALRDWFGSFWTNIALLAIGIVTGIVSARMLGPEGRGQLAEVMFWGAFVAQLGGFSLPSAANIEAARSGMNPRLSSSVVALALAYSVLSLAIFWLFLTLGRVTDVSWLVLTYAIAFVPANIVSQSLLSIDSGMQRFGLFNFLRLVPQSLYLVLMLMLTMVGLASAASFAFAALAGSVLVALVRAVGAWKAILTFPERSTLTRLVVTGAQFYATTILTLLRESGDRLVILAMLDPTALGLYAVAITIAGSAIQTVAGATTTILLPKVVAATDKATQARQVATATSASLFIAALLNGAVAAVSPILIPRLFGADFSGAVPVAVVLCLGQTFRTAADILAWGLRGLDDWKAMPTTAGVALVVFFPLGALLAEPYGPTGIALALAAGNFACLVFVLFRACQKTELEPTAFLIPPRWLFSPAMIFARLRV